jgi:hypothetical protein
VTAVTADAEVGTRARLLSAPIGTIAALGVATAALRLRDPHVSGSWGYCPSRLLLGIDCPGCGGLRAVNDLTHGDLLGAASSNLLFVAALPLIGWVFWRWLGAAWKREQYYPTWGENTWFYVVLVTTMIAFMVVRKLPAGAWLAS